MPITYDPIATTTLNASTNSISFTGISGSYTDLRVVISLVNANNHYLQMDFNGDNGTNYGESWIDGSGTAAAAGTNANQTYIALAQRLTGATYTLWFVDINGYSGSTFKPCLIQANYDNNGSGYVGRQIATWRSTAAITNVRVFSGTTNAFGAGTVVTLYGITKA